MKKPIILAKASLLVEQIKPKMELGADGLELQLLNETLELDGLDRRWKSFKSVYPIYEISRYPIYAIHAPLISGFGDMTIENMLDAEDIYVLSQMFAIADEIGSLQNRNITLVVHSESYYSNMLDVGDVYLRILSQLDKFLTSYKHVRIAIENVSPIRGITKDRLHLSNNFGFDNVELVRHLREDLDTDRIGTILDTCHAMLTEKYINAIYAATDGEYLQDDYSPLAFAKANKDYIFHIHFCDMKGSGYGKGRHGIPFTSITRGRANAWLNILYKEQEYDCHLCLEVEEKDGYEICSGFASTLEVVNEYFNCQGKDVKTN